MPSFRPSGATLLLQLGALAISAPATTTAQSTDSVRAAGRVTVVPGARYKKGGFHRFFFGAHYRDLWTTPIEAERLDLATFDGGLQATKRGGGEQTKSLRFKTPDGRQYAFRSIDKDPELALPPILRKTVVQGIVQDQISAAHPAGPLIVAPLLSAAGVLTDEPRIVVLPQRDPRLGKFEDEFGGMLGILELRPTEGEDEGSFQGAKEVIDTDELFDRLENSPRNQVDTRAFLAARLIDLFVGDWDRHRNQWRWARFGDEETRRWIPIPRDRDQAFVRYDGFLLTIARTTLPQFVNFGPSYPGMLGLTWNGRDVDRRVLVDLERPVFDSIAKALQSRLTNNVIESAVAKLPAPYHRLDSTRLANALKERRDQLPEAARRYYRHLSGEVAVNTTDRDELVVAERVDPRHTEVTVSRKDTAGEAAEPFYRRRFDHDETKEVRLFLHGGDDRVVVRGNAGGGIRLRLIPGKGTNEVVDSSRGGRVNLYTTDPDDRVLPGHGISVSRKPYAPRDTALRDWGTRWQPETWFSGGPDVGIFLGAGLVHTRYGFRHDPYAQRYRLRGGFATGASTGRVDFTAEWRRSNSGLRTNLLARASGIDVLRFHGFGNETPAVEDDEFFRVKQTSLTLFPSLTVPLVGNLELSFGPVLKYSDTDLDPDRFIGITQPYGSGKFGMFGGAAGLRFDRRNRLNAATHGVLFEAAGSFYPSVFDVEDKFGEIHGEVSTYLTADSVPLQPTLALRVGGKRVWGDLIPFQEAAYIGGASTVRLGRERRYAGDASLYGGAELRLFLTSLTLVLPADFGIFGLADVGRVYLDGETSDKWHPAAGGGIWISFLDRVNTLSVAVAKSSERTGVYVRAGFGI
jgi:hypothetical protein